MTRSPKHVWLVIFIVSQPVSRVAAFPLLPLGWRFFDRSFGFFGPVSYLLYRKYMREVEEVAGKDLIMASLVSHYPRDRSFRLQ